jgi:hypothetical protein
LKKKNMRGWIYPTSDNLIDWDVAALAKKDPNDCRFLQQLAMGKKAAYVHLIVPTCLGMVRNEENEMRTIFHIQTFRPSPMQDAILKRQHKIISYCARCMQRPISFHHTPYQVALHFFGGPSSGDDSWSFDFFFGFLCRSCQTMPRISLLVVDETCYMPLATALKKHGFGQAIHMRRFWDETLPEGERLYAALVEMYRFRFRLVNENTRLIISELSGGEEECCYYCKSKHAKLESCSACHAVSFCSNNDDCMRFSQAAHAPLCAHVRAFRFVDVDEICEVRSGGRPCNYLETPAFLRYNEQQTEMENYQRLVARAPHLADESYANDRLMVEALYFAHTVEELGDFGQRMSTCGRRDVYLKIVQVLQQQEQHTLESIVDAGRNIFLYYADTRNVTA